MDACCYNRPFDDQNQDRIRLEAEAVLTILFHCELNDWILVGSELIDFELNKSLNIYKKQKVIHLSKVALEKVSINNLIKERSKYFSTFGIGAFDSLHLAIVEYTKVDVLLTTDLEFIKRSKRISDLEISVMNPVNWIMEVVE